MKSGGNSVGAVGASGVQAEMRESEAGDYTIGAISTVAGAGLVGASLYSLKTGDNPLTGIGLASAGSGFVLWGVAFFRGRPMDGDATGRKLKLGGAYLASAGTTLTGIGVAMDGSKKEEGTPLYIGAGLAAAGLGLTAYTIYRDIQGVKEKKAGLFAQLGSNFSVGPSGIGTAVRF